MPYFSFYQCLKGRRVKLASVELDDGESARGFGIGLAEKILRNQNTDRLPVTSRIVIYNEHGEDLDTIVSEAF